HSRRRGVARGRGLRRTRIARLCRLAGGRFQGATQDPVPGRNPKRRHWQAAAHRPCRKTWIDQMKIAVFGAGAIGGLLAVKLHQIGADVCVIARGPHLAAIRENGMTLKSEGKTVTVRLHATDKADEAGRQDYVIVTLKANGLLPAAPQIAKLMDADTALV